MRTCTAGGGTRFSFGHQWDPEARANGKSKAEVR